MPHADAGPFLVKLAALMQEYDVDRVDVGWSLNKVLMEAKEGKEEARRRSEELATKAVVKWMEVPGIENVVAVKE